MQKRALIAGPWSDVFSTGASEKIPLAFPQFLGRPQTVDTLADVTRLPTGAVPIGLTVDGKRSLGFMNDRFCVVPDVSALGKTDPVWDYRLFVAAAKRWKLPGYDQRDFVEHRYVSDTGELVLDRAPGVLFIQTPKTKGLVGFLGQVGTVDLGGLTVECSTPFAAIVFSSLDGKPLGQSRRMLITAVARAENSGQAFSVGKRSVPERGRPPVLVEPVAGTVTLPVPGLPTVFPLDPTGKRRPPVAVESDSQRMRLNLAGVSSPWCEVVVGK